MKINGSSPLSALQALQAPARRAAPSDSVGAQQGAKVSMSSDASWIQALQAQVGDLDGGVRADVVAETRAALADGSFESGVDMDAVIDSLLAEL